MNAEEAEEERVKKWQQMNTFLVSQFKLIAFLFFPLN